MATFTTNYNLIIPDELEDDYEAGFATSMETIDATLLALANATGVQVWTFTSTPSDAVGEDGDIGFRSNGAVYTKAAGTWGSPQFTLPGTTGATGTSFLAGTGVPSDGLGNDGDTYLDTLTGALYTPKAAGVWPASSGTLIGPTGPAGPTAEDMSIVANAGSTQTLDTDDASVFHVTLTDDCTITIVPNSTLVPVATVVLRQSGVGSWEVTWADDIAWPGGAAPTLSTAPGSIDLLTFMYDTVTQQWLAGNPIIGSEAPAPTLPTLDVEVVGTIEGAPGAADASSYTTTQSFNGGDQGMVIVDVLTTAQDTDPLVPILSGGGFGTAWTMLDEPRSLDTGTGTRRTATRFAARASVPGTAAPLTVTYRAGNAIGGTLTAQNGCLLEAKRIEGTPPGTGLNTVITSTTGDSSTAAGGGAGSSGSFSITMGAPIDTDSVFLLTYFGNSTNAVTPEAGWTLVTGSDITHTSPTTVIRSYIKAATDQSFSGAIGGAGAVYALIGAELEQG